jgi:hypothetical protein
VHSPTVGPAPGDVLERMHGVMVNGHPSTVSLVPAPVAAPICDRSTRLSPTHPR